MNKWTFIILLAIAVIAIIVIAGMFNPGPAQNRVEKPQGDWKDTTDFQWVSNGTCCGEKEQMKQEYIVNGNVENTRWTDTGRTRDNNSMLPPDDWYYTGNGNIYTREKEFRKYICKAGECIFSVTNTQWYNTGAMMMEHINNSKDVTISPGREDTWYIVIKPEANNVSIVFKILAEGYNDLPVVSSTNLVTEYHSGPVKLPSTYIASIRMQSGQVTIYILDKLGYEETFKQ